MRASIDTTIARAILLHLERQIGSGPTARAFVRLEGFSRATYGELLAMLDAAAWRAHGRALLVRSIDPIAGFEGLAIEPERSATWYRNNLPADQTLLLILNRRTSDAQSLKDLYAIGEQTLTRDGLGELIAASFSAYQLDGDQRRTLNKFVSELRRLRLEPQLRDLTEFLRDVDAAMAEHPGTSLPEAIADALPALGLFRCRELAAHLNTSRGAKLIRTVKDAAQLGAEVLNDRERQAYLERLQKISLADDRPFGGPSAAQKVELLRRFLDGHLADSRADLLQVLGIDWKEVSQVFSTRKRPAKPELYRQLAEGLEADAEVAGLAGSEALAEVLESLREGREPESETIERLLVEGGEALGRTLRNDLRRMVRPPTRRDADFLAGLTALAVELLHTRQDAVGAGLGLRVSVALDEFEQRPGPHEAARVFRAVYGGIERTFPAVQWRLEPLWALAAREPVEAEEGPERERAVKAEIPFRISVVGPNDNELANAELRWQYRADSPAAATAQTLTAEAELLEGGDLGPLFGANQRLRVPLYNVCQPSDEIGDLDVRHPLSTLGPWYEAPGDLRAALERQLRPVARTQSWTALDGALAALERAWASFIRSSRGGLLDADVAPLLGAYEAFLSAALHGLQSGTEVGIAYRLISQAWVIGPPSFTSWAIMPLLHPLKLLWWRERARHFAGLIARLLDPDRPASIVDMRRFQKELAATYGSSGFPPVLALPAGEGRPAARFLPVEEAEGYELFFHERPDAQALGLDPDSLADDENALAALRAVEGISAVVQDYIETYPFVRDGVEIFLFECRNGALPGMLIEQLSRMGRQRGWSIRLTVVVHTSEHGAPLFRRVSQLVTGGHPGVERQGRAYFPPIAVKVLECAPEALFEQQDDTDIVVLADVLASRGQEVISELVEPDGEDLPLEGYLPTYRARQEPFERGEQYRRILLTAPQQPALARFFLLAQHAALDRQKRPPRPRMEARFYRDLTLDEWRYEIERLHGRFNWIVCYDTSIDRFLLQATFHEQVQVIRYSLGLGAKRQHNLTVSSSGRAQAIVVKRLAARLGQMFPRAEAFCAGLAEGLVAEAKQISGDIVLRAAGPGAFLNELIGLVAAKFATERRYAERHPGALSTWILLDDFEHWFDRGKFPDLLFVAIGRDASGGLALHLEVLEAKCVGELSFGAEAADAEVQVRRGVGRLAPAFAPGDRHLDALYWYDQLYRAVAGNLAVEPEQRELWELFRDRLHNGGFRLELSGHTWIFCYDGQANLAEGASEQPFAPVPDAPEVPLLAHHYGRNELARLLSALIGARGGPEPPPEVWAEPPAPPEPVVASPAIVRAPTAGYVDQAPSPVQALGVPTAIAPNAPQRVAHQPSATEPRPAAGVPPATAPAAQQDDNEQEWLKAKAQELERALRRRGVQVLPINPANADVGPSIVRFKLRLSGNETIKKLQAVAIDLARDLALTSTPLIENLLGTNFVGVDVPRPRVEVVELLPILRALPRPGPAELPTIIGKTPDGKLHIDDLAEFPHLLVAGATGSGKSVFLRSVLLSLMTQYAPGSIELLIVDPKHTDFSFFDGLPYLRGGKVFTQPEEAREALLDLVRSEMPRRQQLMKGRSLKIKEFNRRYPAEALPPIVALIDEYAQLLSIMPNKKDAESFERDLMSLAAVARSTGIHLILATQRPSVNVVTGTLKANLPSRIAFQVPTNNDSRVVLDAPGAENLLGRGDMLFRRPSGEIVRLQAPYMDEEAMQDYLRQLVRREGA